MRAQPASWSKRRSMPADAAKAAASRSPSRVAEAAELAGKILGMTLITHQTGPEGRVVRRLLIEETLPIEKELYLGILVDRGEGKPVFMASAAGGMDIEQVAAERPEAILKQYIDPGMGLEPFQARKIAFALGLKGTQLNRRRAVSDQPLSRISRDGCFSGRNQSLHQLHRRPACSRSMPN